MSRSTNLIVWLIGLLGCAIPIVIIYVSNMVPNAGAVSGVTFMDVARQAYANVLFFVIAVSGIAIAEAIILFFRMVEVGEQKATPALWLLTMVLLIVFSSISYARVLGDDFDPASVSDQQLGLACIGASVAIMAALSLRMSMIRLEGIARQHIHDNAVMSTLEDLRDSQEEGMDIYDYDPFPTAAEVKQSDEATESRIPEPSTRAQPLSERTAPAEPLIPAARKEKMDLPEPQLAVTAPAPTKPVPEAPEIPETRLPETPAAPAVLPEKAAPEPVEKTVDADPVPDTRPVPVAGNKVKRARARARAKGR
ncbi:MAG: hypothetical protein GY948_23355 [Alphaproteobacteria bacterium]|nr:hypothetical protein [Alphaproteobacteria bacterium]